MFRYGVGPEIAVQHLTVHSGRGSERAAIHLKHRAVEALLVCIRLFLQNARLIET